MSVAGGLSAGWMSWPPLQGIQIILATFVLEDPAVVGTALLAGEGKIGWLTGAAALLTGIVLGDLGLYAIGRWARPLADRYLPVSAGQVAAARVKLSDNLLWAVLAARVTPGARTPTYLAAGLLHMPFPRFAALVVAASGIWTLTLYSLVAMFGGAVAERFGGWSWLIFAGILAIIISREGVPMLARSLGKVRSRAVSIHEFWPPLLFYFPVIVQWILLSIRYRQWMLPTIANPSIHSGGMIGEAKSDVLDLVPEEHRHRVPPYVTLKRRPVPAERQLAQAMESLRRAGIELPVVAKPEIGQRGDGVRPIHSGEDLLQYIEAFPAGQAIMLQRLVPWPNEVSILYVRIPGEPRGTTPHMTRKEFPVVTGDGRRTLRELILAHERFRVLSAMFFARHAARLDEVLPEGEPFPLVFAGAHSKGTLFLSGAEWMTPALRAAIVEFGDAIPEFYFGRFDLRYRNLEALQRGEDWQVLEINGAAGEPTNLWDPSISLPEAYRLLLWQYGLLFRIGGINRGRGFEPMSAFTLLGELLEYQRVSRRYPPCM